MVWVFVGKVKMEMRIGRFIKMGDDNGGGWFLEWVWENRKKK